MTAVLSIPDSPYYVDKAKDFRFEYHEGQRRVMDSRKRFILMLAGTQSGKTVLAPWWLYREICRCGPGDYLAVSPTYKLMQLKLLPEFLALFERRLGMGTYHVSDRIFEFSTYGGAVCHGKATGTTTQVFFGHAQDPDSLESATAKAAILDEAGQKKFRYGSWEAVQRRLSIHQGRVLLPTTPYTLGWLKAELHDEAVNGSDEVDLVQFDSTMNPAFPQAEFDRQRAKMPRWKFDMMYRGRFTRPAGMIYDCFHRDVHVIPAFSIPSDWPRHLGLDFGGVNTAGVFLANEPGTQRYVAYRAYHEGGRTAKEHTRHLMKREAKAPRATGGSKSEGQWRDEFAAAGLPVKEPPVSEVEVGIDRVYAMLKNHPMMQSVDKEARHDPKMPYLEFTADLKALLSDLESYSRELDDIGEPTEKIEDKETYHLLDGLRYKAAEIMHTVKEPRYGGTGAQIM